MDVLHRERLGEVIEGLVAEAEDRGVDRRHPGDEHHRRSRLPALDRAQDVEPAEARHLDVGDDEVEGLQGEKVEGLLRARGRGHHAAVRLEGEGQEPKYWRMVVDQKNREHLAPRGWLQAEVTSVRHEGSFLVSPANGLAARSGLLSPVPPRPDALAFSNEGPGGPRDFTSICG